tara:strand:- start:636 stop:956 length:321 start_codon:yes stop_codon:yes gene_type:complete
VEFFAEYYLQAGAVGVIVMLFVYTTIAQNKRMESQETILDSLAVENREQTKMLSTLESITIKLIDRFNQSDQTAVSGREKVMSEISDLTEKVAEIRGVVSRINGKN